LSINSTAVFYRWGASENQLSLELVKVEGEIVHVVFLSLGSQTQDTLDIIEYPSVVDIFHELEFLPNVLSEENQTAGSQQSCKVFKNSLQLVRVALENISRFILCLAIYTDISLALDVVAGTVPDAVTAINYLFASVTSDTTI
jgi:hypothetical protein